MNRGSEADSKREVAKEAEDILDISFLEEVNRILNHKWFNFLDKPEKLLDIQKQCLTFYESGAKKLMKFPRPIPII